MNEYQDAGAAGSIVFFIAAVKSRIPDRFRKWIPCIAVALGMVYGSLIRSGGGLLPSLTAGAYSGLAAVGTQDGAKVTLRKK